MSRLVALLTLSLALAAPAGASTPAPSAPTQRLNWQIQPGRSLALIALDSSEASLIERFGAFNVQPAQIKLDAGEPYPASVLFPRDANKRIALVWRDSVKRSGVAVAVVRGERSFWTLPGGLGLGSTVAELEKRNGRSLLLTGLGPAHTGQIVGWNNGALDASLARVSLLLGDYNYALLSAPARQQVLVGPYLSSLRAVQLLNPAVVEMRVQLVIRACHSLPVAADVRIQGQPVFDLSLPGFTAFGGCGATWAWWRRQIRRGGGKSIPVSAAHCQRPVLESTPFSSGRSPGLRPTAASTLLAGLRKMPIVSAAGTANGSSCLSRARSRFTLSACPNRAKRVRFRSFLPAEWLAPASASAVARTPNGFCRGESTDSCCALTALVKSSSRS
ncbi:MAG: hypothetical protein U1E47_08390 [Rivihabitans pingtungensis]